MVQIHPPLPTTMIKKDIELFLGPIIEASGCELWGIEVTSGKGKGRILRIFIDAIQGVDISDCEKVSREIDYHFQFESIFSEVARWSHLENLNTLNQHYFLQPAWC